jgi:hypothetical protein
MANVEMKGWWSNSLMEMTVITIAPQLKNRTNNASLDAEK